ncbi:Fatty acyl-CoA reductase 8, partial [Mucuna pruriens]
NYSTFFKGKSILVTGSTGYLAKVFIEKILRIQPEIQKLYLLVRALNTDTAIQRMQNEVIRIDLFGVLQDKWGEDFDSFMSKKVVVIAGDVSLENLGLKDENLKNEMLEDIDILVNFAASTKFDERFDISMGVNTMGALHVINFAKHCHKLKALVHISTDLVISCVITAIVAHSNQAPKNFIYHVASSFRNPLKISDIHTICYDYFKKTPYKNKKWKTNNHLQGNFVDKFGCIQQLYDDPICVAT